MEALDEAIRLRPLDFGTAMLDVVEFEIQLERMVLGPAVLATIIVGGNRFGQGVVKS